MNVQLQDSDVTDLRKELEAAGALSLVRAAFKDQSAERLLALEIAIAEACAEARRFQNLPAPDWLERRRARDRRARELLTLANATDKLRAFLTEFPECAENVATVLSRAKDLDQAKKLAQALQGDPARACNDFLIALKRVLVSAKASANKKAFVHGWQVGPLLYPKHIARRQGTRPKVAETGLAFQLTLSFRRFSAGHTAFAYLQNGEPMPNYGAPHYELSSQIIAVALGGAPIAPVNLKKRLNKLLIDNKGIGLAAWPTD